MLALLCSCGPGPHTLRPAPHYVADTQIAADRWGALSGELLFVVVDNGDESVDAIDVTPAGVSQYDGDAVRLDLAIYQTTDGGTGTAELVASVSNSAVIAGGTTVLTPTQGTCLLVRGRCFAVSRVSGGSLDGAASYLLTTDYLAMTAASGRFLRAFRKADAVAGFPATLDPTTPNVSGDSDVCVVAMRLRYV